MGKKKEVLKFEGECPYCHSGNYDYVDDDRYTTKYICHDCDNDFLVSKRNDSVTDRHGFPIDPDDYEPDEEECGESEYIDEQGHDTRTGETYEANGKAWGRH